MLCGVVGIGGNDIDDDDDDADDGVVLFGSAACRRLEWVKRVARYRCRYEDCAFDGRRNGL